MNSPITITESAKLRIQALLEQNSAYAIRIGLKTKGCSGLAYTLEYADMKNPFEEEISFGSNAIYIEPKAMLYIVGTELDYVQNEIESGFVFKNPNEKGRCGCGKSFHV